MSDPGGPHLARWQRRSFDLSSGNETPRQTADKLREHIQDIQFARASSQLSQAGWALLLRRYSDRYSSVLDSDDPRTGLNNFADSALHLSRSQKNHSAQWQSGLSTKSLAEMTCVKSMERNRETVQYVRPEEESVTVGGSGWSLCAPSRTETDNSTFRPTPRLTLSNPAPNASSAFPPPLPHQPPPTFPNQNFTPSVPNPSKRKTFCGAEMGETSRGQHGAPPAPKPGGGSFKTAREQLIVEQQKKNSAPPQRGHTPGLAAAMKKSLGANRPRGTFSKFVSPLPRQEEEEENGARSSRANQEEGGVLDERLKNFEPKIVELILAEIMDHGPPVSWDDIAGLDFAKTTIKEIVVWPMLRPDIFTGLRGPPKGILLFGPPGTGKTLIGKCIASQSGATFFSISASSLTSKWVGEGEKMVRALFAIARLHQPAVIFIDEIDSLLSQRSDSEHESSRRIKTEFLVQLDGATTAADERILVVGATNRPQEIDEAARRRLAKRLYVPLPEGGARRQIVSNLMSKEKNSLKEEELQSIVTATEGFSGADMTQLCREAALGPIRSIRFSDIVSISADQVRPINFSDFSEALRTVRPSVSSRDLETYEDWNQTYGCGR